MRDPKKTDMTTLTPIQFHRRPEPLALRSVRQRQIDGHAIYPAISLVLKVTERCNLACPYCYFFFSDDQSFEKHPPLISDDTIESLIRFLEQAVAENGLRQISIGFHGGEPLLLKKKTFAAMCERLTSRLAPLCELKLSVQTNGVLVDKDWVALFARFGIGVGVSFDGDATSHDKTRITKKGEGTYEKTRASWDMLRKAKAEQRLANVGLLCVIDPKQSGRKVFEHFVHELQARKMDFLLPDLTHDSTEVTPDFVEQCGDYLLEVCQSWFEQADPGVYVRFIGIVTGPLLAREVSPPVAPYPQSAVKIMTISSNGEISADDVYRTLAPRFRETGYRLDNATLAQFQQSELSGELVDAQITLPRACRACLWRGICHGGLKQHRFSARNGFDNPSIYCKALMRTYVFICQMIVRAGVAEAALERRLSMLAGHIDDIAATLSSPLDQDMSDHAQL